MPSDFRSEYIDIANFLETGLQDSTLGPCCGIILPSFLPSLLDRVVDVLENNIVVDYLPHASGT